MSPNKNYVSGRAFEYKRKKYWESEGYTVIRASGSHGPFDLIAIRDSYPVRLIQCKRVETQAQAARLVTQFLEAPPFPLNGHFEQILEAWIKKTRELRTASV